ncbi:PREDICTED: uncharacterized protein LOC107189612 [Dufourea novaeangliae]|uniref:uncharacterized protein LOC107189612 n=1 Tax=Dufourea novaeangliae TaxID=178035 RepID=UPI000766E61E|nr:PREDICTED: uncharacterized protein LOC107189612 [Dufourea novaeangliae]
MPNKKSQARKKQLKEKKKEKKEDENETQYLEEIIDTEENVAKDFDFLMNAPVSVDNYFVLPSEKTFGVDTSKYSEYFTLDLKTLSAAVETIPFNEIVDIDARYFTNDQLTDIHNKAEQGKQKYNEILNKLKVVSDVRNVEESRDSIDDTTEDLDFLLSLKEPVEEPLTVKSLSVSSNTDTKKSTKSGVSVKSIDLEKWLDSVLDD